MITYRENIRLDGLKNVYILKEYYVNDKILINFEISHEH